MTDEPTAVSEVKAGFRAGLPYALLIGTLYGLTLIISIAAGGSP